MENTMNLTFNVNGTTFVKPVLSNVYATLSTVHKELLKGAEHDTDTDTALSPVTSYTVPFNITDKTLRKEVDKINTNITNMKTAMLEIGAALFRIHKNRLWIKDPTTRDLAFHEFVAQAFGIKRATAYRWIEYASPYLTIDGDIIPEIKGMNIEQRTALMSDTIKNGAMSRKEIKELTAKIEETPDLKGDDLKQAIEDARKEVVHVIPDDCIEIGLFLPNSKVEVHKSTYYVLSPDTIDTIPDNTIYNALCEIAKIAYKSLKRTGTWSIVSAPAFDTAPNSEEIVRTYVVSAKCGKGDTQYRFVVQISSKIAGDFRGYYTQGEQPEQPTGEKGGKGKKGKRK